MLNIVEVLYLVGYLASLIAGAWCVSEGGDILGEKYDATIIGGFIISWLNTAPETIFFITALESNSPSFAVGAISGSVIVVCTVAVGSCVYIGAKSRETGTIHLQPGVRRQAHILGGSLIVITSALIFGFQYWIGILGVTYYVGFLCWTIFHRTASTPSTAIVHKSPSVESQTSIVIEDVAKEHESDDDEEEQPTWKGVAYLLAGAILIYSCSEPFISSVVNIGKGVGLSPVTLAFFFAPIASEAPEILESISLSRKGKTQSINIAFSNLVGGTLSKTTLLLGILCFYAQNRGYTWVSPTYTVSMSLVLLCALSSAAFGFSEKHSAGRGLMLAALFFFCGIVQCLLSYHTGGEDAVTIN
ncbi:antiporter CaxA [Acrasis kona]|uniref:Antiporter CaxA n=1 Tax=Acrasis kona TaxID=1008807 RepID=A0AAW2ZIC3_9EUKA